MLAPGESIDLGTRVDGGPVIRRDESVDDAYALDGTGGELYRDEIQRLAEAAGLEVSEGDAEPLPQPTDDTIDVDATLARRAWATLDLLCESDKWSTYGADYVARDELAEKLHEADMIGADRLRGEA